MKKNAYLIVILVCLISPTFAQKTPPKLSKNTVKQVVAAMTTEEKVSLVIGTGMNLPGIKLPPNMQGPVVGEVLDGVAGAAGTTFPIKRLGIPAIIVADGPAGLRIQPTRKDDNATYYCTAFPIATLLASTWDTELVKSVGKAMGNEVKEYGIDVLLAPALNTHRNPLGGRNFEYYSEDPLISGSMAAAIINGVQSNGVGTSIKHFAVNNHETNRNTINVKINERALREIYLRGFQYAFQKSNPWTVMSSYNKINGTYASENHDLLSTILRDEWHYKGFVMTDWFGGKNAAAQINAGNDLLMPGTMKQQDALLEAAKNKTLHLEALNKAVENILNIIVQTPTFNKYQYSNKPNLTANAITARKAAADGMVLLKNEGGALPLKSKEIAVFGNSSYDMFTGGTGSGDVNEAYTISLTDGLKNAGFTFSEKSKNTYESYIKKEKANRKPKAISFLLPDAIAEMNISKEEIEQSANESAIAIITIGRNAGEFADRKLDGDFNLTDTEIALIKNVSEVFHSKGKKAIVILNIGGVIETASWKSYPDAILLAWQPGQEAGNAIVDVLSGKVNPSGKLATTFPISYTDVPDFEGFPGKELEPADPNDFSPTRSAKAAEIEYKDGIYMGYRYYDKAKKNVSYEFGYGLSYTTFAYSNLKVSQPVNGKVNVSIDVTNTGKLAGREVAQVYLTAPSTLLDKPEKELKAFAKTILLAPNAKETLSFVLDASALASFNTQASSWIAEKGTYTISVGASSKNLKQSANFNLPKEIITEKVHKALSPEVGIEENKIGK